MTKKNKKNWVLPQGVEPTEFDLKILDFQNKGRIVPTPSLIKTQEQIDGIRRAGEINTGILDMLETEIKEGITTEDIDRLVAEYTHKHGATCAPYGYDLGDGTPPFPKHCCTSINEVVAHGIPSEEEELWNGDIINVDVTTIKDGYYADASRMYMIGNVKPKVRRLVECTKECLEIGLQTAKPWTFVGEIGKAIGKHAHKNGFYVVRDLAGHGTGNDFHEEPDVDHYDTRHKGMLLVPGMVITIEPMLNMKNYEVFLDDEDPYGWTIISEDELPSAQWEHTILITETGNEILTH